MIGAMSLSGPKVTPISKDPVFISLKNKVESFPTLEGKLKALNVQYGLYNQYAPAQPDKKLRARTVLLTMVLEDAAKAAKLSPDVECVLRNALQGVPDDADYGVLIPTGAAIQKPEVCDTSMTTFQALEAFEKPYPKATSLIATGIATAVPAKYGDYKALLAKTFKSKFIKTVNPFTNPVTKYPLYIALGLVGVYLVSRIGRG